MCSSMLLLSSSYWSYIPSSIVHIANYSYEDDSSHRGVFENIYLFLWETGKQKKKNDKYQIKADKQSNI